MPAEPEATEPIPESELLDRARPQLQRLQRMETVGALAAGIAHEFNNLLLAVRGNLAMALMTPGGSESAAERLRLADVAAGRASELSQRLMILARPGTDKPEAIDFNRVIQEAGQLATRAWRGRIALTLKPALEPARVWMDHSLAAQTILSLCLNAGEAFPPRASGGRVTVGNDIVRLESARALRVGAIEGALFLCCTVADSGPGIAPEALPHLFTPFFTTKPQGTGLGLAMADLAARHAGGFIEATNIEEGGARFSLYLPLQEAMEICELEEKKLDCGARTY